MKLAEDRHKKYMEDLEKVTDEEIRMTNVK